MSSSVQARGRKNGGVAAAVAADEAVMVAALGCTTKLPFASGRASANYNLHTDAQSFCINK